jgi:hypothetical protein
MRTVPSRLKVWTLLGAVLVAAAAIVERQAQGPEAGLPRAR